MATKNELDAMLERLRTGGKPNAVKHAPPPTTADSLLAKKQDSANSLSANQSTSTASNKTAPDISSVNAIDSGMDADNNRDKPSAEPRESTENPKAKKSQKRKNKRSDSARAINSEARNPDRSEAIIDSMKTQTSKAISEISQEKSNSAEEIPCPKAEKTDKNRKGIVAALENILDEDPDSLAHERSEKAEPDNPQDSARKNRSPKLKQRIYAVFGVLFSIFAVIGFITVCKAGINYFHSFTSGEEKRSDFIDIINPAVVMDISEFPTPSELESDQLITSAIWSLIMNSDDLDKYSRTFDVISVPEIDVEACAAQLFGSSIPQISHQTVGSGELKFYYDEANKSYNVPVNPISFSYIPEIESISKDGSVYTLIVNYMSELPSWMEDSPNFERDASKIVEYKLVESGDSYTISSVRVITVNSII